MLSIVVKTRFSAIHHWPDCPHEEVTFLKYPHRHIFYVTIKWRVGHNDREKEFIMMKNEVDGFLFKNWHNKNLGKMSCETMAEDLAVHFNADYVSVFEDNENGVEFIRC